MGNKVAAKVTGRIQAGKTVSGPKLGFWALVDQGLVSAGTFFANVVLARNLTPDDYGRYALFLSVFLALNAAHTSLVIYPLTTSPAAQHRRNLQQETAAALFLTLVLFAPAVAVMAAFGSYKAPWAMLMAASAATLGWQIQETLRRGLMAGLRHKQAVWGDALSYLGQAVLIWVLVRAGFRDLSHAFLAMAVTSLAAALLQAVQLGLGGVSVEALVAFARSAWKLGGWNLAASGAGILSSQAYVWILAAFHCPAESGKLLAVLAVLGLSHPLLFSLGNLLTPAAAISSRQQGKRAAWNATGRYWKPVMLLTGAYLTFLLVMPSPVLRLLYGRRSDYCGLNSELRLGAIAYLLMFATQRHLHYLAGLRRVKDVFAFQVSGAGAGLLAGLPLMKFFGVIGACAGMSVCNIARLLSGYALTRRLQESAAVNEPSRPGRNALAFIVKTSQ